MADIIERVKARLVTAGPAVTAVPGVRASSAIRRYVEGLTTGAQLRSELALLGYDGIRLERLAISAALDRSLAVAVAEADRLAVEFRADRLDDGLLLAHLVLAGFAQEAAARRVGLERSRRPPPTARRSAVGLVFLPSPGDLVEPAARRRAAVGLTFALPAGAVVEGQVRRRAAVGLRFDVPAAAVAEVETRRRSAVGLAFEVPSAGLVPADRRRRAAVGVRFQLPLGG